MQDYFSGVSSMESEQAKKVDRLLVDNNEAFVIESFGKNMNLPACYEFIRPIGSGGGGLVMYQMKL